MSAQSESPARTRDLHDALGTTPLLASEKAGRLLGYSLGIWTGAISFVRDSRTFHPHGLCFHASVEPISSDPVAARLAGHAFVRFSSAWWKEKEWVDVLGLTVRFTKSPELRAEPLSDDQDLLFATIEYPWQTPIAPLFTRFHDFFKNPFYAVSPFEVFGQGSERDWRKFRIVPVCSARREPNGPSRNEHLRDLVSRGEAVLRLEIASPEEEKRGEWRGIATIQVERETVADAPALRFSPFQCGRGVRPRGFTHALREGTYRLSQWGRALRDSVSS